MALTPDEPQAKLLGRNRELEELATAVTAASGGRGQLILIEGDAGVGKTRLVEAVADAASDTGMAAAWGRCWSGEGAPPFWPWVQIARQLVNPSVVAAGGALAQILPESEGTPGEDALLSDRSLFRLLDGIATDMITRSRTDPLLIVLDDLHLGDHASLLLAALLANQARSAPLLIIATHRELDPTIDPDVAKAFNELSEGALRIPLAGVDAAATAEIWTRMTGVEPSDEETRVIRERTAGNPLFVQEMAKLVLAHGRPDDVTSAADLPIPRNVQELLRRRFARLSSDCFRSLSTAAAMGPRFDLEVLEAVVDLPRERLAALLDEATLQRVIVPVEGTRLFAFVHDLMREGLYGELGPQEKRAVHLKVADALESRNAHPARIAHHLLRAAPDVSPDRLVRHSHAAAERALSVFAYADAASHFRRALEVVEAGGDAALRARLLLGLADSIARGGNRVEAESLYAEAISAAEILGDPELLGRAVLGRAGGPGGFEVPTHNEEIAPLIEAALDALPEEPSPLRATLAARLSVALTYTDRQGRRLQLSSNAVALAKSAGDAAAHAYALSAHCDAIAGPEHVAERHSAAEQMIELALSAQDLELELLGRRFRIVALAEQGLFDELDRELSRFERASDALHQPISAWYVPLWGAMRTHMRGRFDECERLLTETERIGVDQAGSENARMLVFSLKWPLLHETDRLVEVDDFVESIRRDFGMIPSTQYVFGVHDLWMGRLAEAEVHLKRIVAAGLNSVPRDTIWLAGTSILTLLARQFHETQLLQEIYDALLPFGELFAFDGIAAVCFGSVGHWLGMAAAALGRSQIASEHFEAAIDAHERAGATVWLAHTRSEFGDLLRAQGDPSQQKRGQELQQQARQTYASLGLTNAVGAPGIAAQPLEASAEGGRFVQQGDFWDVVYAGSSAALKDTKGMHDLARLLAQPGREIHVSDLTGTPRSGASPDTVLDERARSEIKSRVQSLEAQIEEAESDSDVERAVRAREELDFLTKELAAAYGLGGRARSQSDPVERARKTVAWRLRDAIARVDRAHPKLGRHLSNSIKTGSFCSYEPEDRVDWEL